MALINLLCEYIRIFFDLDEQFFYPEMFLHFCLLPFHNWINSGQFVSPIVRSGMIGILELFNLHIKLDLSFNATAAPPPPGSQIDNNEFLCNK